MSVLPEPLKPTSEELMTFAGHHVKGETRTFDWSSFKDSVDNRNSTDLTFDKFDNQNIHQSDSSVEAISNKVADYLYDALQVRVTANREELATKISSMFMDPEQKSKEGCLTFSESKDGMSRKWEYRFAFADSKGDAADYFATTLSTINLSEKIETKEPGWFPPGRPKGTSKDFSASINAMQLVVQKDFKYTPPRDS